MNLEFPVDEVIRRRRSRKVLDGSPVSKEAIAELLELAILAPMHRLTNPWRFRILDKQALERLCQWWSDPTELRAGSDDPGAAAAAAKVFQSRFVHTIGAVIVVTAQRDADPLINAENRDAVAAATQNILLAAEARHLGVFWSTGPHWRSSTTQDWLGIDRDREALVAVLWLGGQVGDIKPPARLSVEQVATWL